MKQMGYIFFVLILSFGFISINKKEIPEGFVNVKTIIPDLEVELRYYSSHNFVGDTVDGYLSNNLYLTKAAALQLKKVQDELKNKNLCLKVYDGYRPQSAVNHFVQWAKNVNDTIKKKEFYPEVFKKNLFKEEYIASRSGHSRGSTVDLTIINGETNEPLDMGSAYDFFGKESWVDYDGISKEQKANRQLLQSIMKHHGFKNYAREWWHFTLKNEPFPNTYFDFVID